MNTARLSGLAIRTTIKSSRSFRGPVKHGWVPMLLSQLQSIQESALGNVDRWQCAGSHLVLSPGASAYTDAMAGTSDYYSVIAYIQAENGYGYGGSTDAEGSLSIEDGAISASVSLTQDSIFIRGANCAAQYLTQPAGEPVPGCNVGTGMSSRTGLQAPRFRSPAAESRSRSISSSIRRPAICCIKAIFANSID